MGNLFSRNQENATITEIKRLQDRLASLENLDKNNDGKVSKGEFEFWAKQQKVNLEGFKQKIIEQEEFKHQKEIIDKDGKIKELSKELRSLKELNRKREREVLKERSELLHGTNNSSNNTSESTSGTTVPVGTASIQAQQLSEQQIKKFVEDLLQDESVNIGYLPDWVERQLYINFFNLLIGLLKKTVSTTSIKLLGHQVTLDMVPQEVEEIKAQSSSTNNKTLIKPKKTLQKK